MTFRNRNSITRYVLWAASAAALSCACAARADVDFNAQVRPILSNACFQCHGPDDSSRAAGLRLDMKEGSGGMRGAGAVIDENQPSASELVARITAGEPAVRMPPEHSGKQLKPEEIETLRAWVEDGARYERHWAFQPPQRPSLPDVEDAAWVRNPIDAFVLARLEANGLTPSPAAGARTLLRRLALDLVGLPPEPETVRSADQLATEKGYRAAVERYLASPHFGERWGRVWLDAARYADSNGFEKDRPREVWAYRDWVVRALNADKPYDRFIVEQIAGDLLPGAGQSERVATGFLRNSMVNEEGGIDPEEFRMVGMFDRMHAIGEGVLGLTMQCAQCHTHKFDPITHTDYYRTLALINNSYEAHLTVYTPDEQAERERIVRETRRIEEGLKRQSPDWRERMAEWEARVEQPRAEWVVVRPEPDGTGGQKHYLQEDGSVLARGYTPSQVTTEFTAEINQPRVAAVRLELLNDPTLPHRGPGRSMEGLCALSEFQAVVTEDGEPPRELKFTRASADVNPPVRELAERFDDGSGKHRVTGPSEMAIDDDQTTAWGIDVGPGRSNASRKAVFVLDEPLKLDGPARITFKLVQMHGEHYLEDLYNQNLGRFRFSVTADENAEADPLPVAVRAIIEKPADERTPSDADRVFGYWRTTVDQWTAANEEIDALWADHPQGISQLVLEERPEPRETHRLDRGEYTKPAERVDPGVPGFLHAFEAESPDRLDFARWLVDRKSPTTARSIVNRIWQAYFGVGLVETSGDFGAQGAPPSHPKLLDWLAVELMENDWRLKHIHRLIVDSATYRQSSRVTPELLRRDPNNRLLARGARFRVDAEIVRDSALAASGLLNREMGGPGVYPPAPEFLFKPPVSFAPKVWDYDTGPDKYRRALYTFRYRSQLYPAYQVFDAPTGETACVRRVRSNTPLQALTTLNEDLFVECARALAERALDEAGDDPAQRINYMFRRCVARGASDEEQELLSDFADARIAEFAEQPDAARKLIGEKRAGEGDPVELAAWTALARVVINLDEAITRE